MTAIIRPMENDVIRNMFLPWVGFSGQEVFTSTLLWILETCIFFLHVRIKDPFSWNIKKNPYQSPSHQMILHLPANKLK